MYRLGLLGFVLAGWEEVHLRYHQQLRRRLWLLDVEGRTSRKLLNPSTEKPKNFWPMYGDGFIYLRLRHKVREGQGRQSLKSWNRNEYLENARRGRRAGAGDQEHASD